MCHPDADTGVAPIGDVRERSFTVDTAGASMPVFEAAPTRHSQGSVIVVHDIHGASDFYRDLARRYATVGYTSYLPDLFVRQGPLPERTREAAFARSSTFSYQQSIDDLRHLISVLREHSSGKVGAVGFCMGGTLVMLLASREPQLAAGVIYYGFPANPTPSELRPHEPIQEADAVETPLLGFWGDQDHGVGMDNVERYRVGLAAAGKRHDFSIYPDLPHGFLTFDDSSPNFARSADSWNKTLQFFREYVD
ncbi:MAG TPA: dienelactone hydrolase family protein [Thermomicrobiales bacterium]|nr:dienelactone hydrolase family protein [Thermomicrobiales bacterium]